jgi:MFS family permease
MNQRPSALVEALYRRESLAWGLIGITLGLVEGATAAILVKQGYAGQASAQTVNLAVAFISGAPALSNVFSFLWANLAHGRARVQLMVRLLAGFAGVVGLLGLAPSGSGGLALVVMGVILARVLWAGILTVRSSIWTANYPRHMLAKITGRLVVISSLGMVAIALIAGAVLQLAPSLTRWLYLLAALCGVVAAWFYRRSRVRRQYQLLAAEIAAVGDGGVFSLGILRRILREDPQYRRFMFWMGLYGAGNLMANAQLVIVFADHLHLDSTTQIAILSILPMLLVPFFTPVWARLFDGGHVIEYRARQCWVLIASMICMTLGTFTESLALLWLGSFFMGVATAGANLGWNLGHSDFASLGKMQQYMGINVTLTGLRGLTAPPAGVLAYELLEAITPGAGRWSLLLPVCLTLAGGLGFNHMKGSREGRDTTTKADR